MSKFDEMYEKLMMESKKIEKFEDFDELADYLENKYPNFQRLIITNEDEFFKDYTSGKYDWKFVSYNVSKDKEDARDKIDKNNAKMKALGYKEYAFEDNYNSIAAAFYKKK